MTPIVTPLELAKEELEYAVDIMFGAFPKYGPSSLPIREIHSYLTELIAKKLLQMNAGNSSKVARIMGINRNTIISHLGGSSLDFCRHHKISREGMYNGERD